MELLIDNGYDNDLSYLVASESNFWTKGIKIRRNVSYRIYY